MYSNPRDYLRKVRMKYTSVCMHHMGFCHAKAGRPRWLGNLILSHKMCVTINLHPSKIWMIQDTMASILMVHRVNLAACPLGHIYRDLAKS